MPKPALRQAKANLGRLENAADAPRRVQPGRRHASQQVYYRPGEIVPARRPVVALLPPGNLKLRFFAPEALLPQIKYGETVAGHLRRLRQGPDREGDLHLAQRRIHPAGDLQPGGARQARLPDRGPPEHPEKFRVGQPVTVTLPQGAPQRDRK